MSLIGGNEGATWATGIGSVPVGEAAPAAQAADDPSASPKHDEGWKEAVIEECIAACIDWIPDDPQETLRRLIAWREEIALDPAVSDRAAALATQPAAVTDECGRPMTYWGGKSATQPAPKHDEGRDAAEVVALADELYTLAKRREFLSHRVSLAEIYDHINRLRALATQPAARRVTDEDVDRALAVPMGLNTKVADMLCHPDQNSASEGPKWKRAIMRAALESFAQSGAGSSSTSPDLAAEGVSE